MSTFAIATVALLVGVLLGVGAVFGAAVWVGRASR